MDAGALDVNSAGDLVFVATVVCGHNAQTVAALAFVNTSVDATPAKSVWVEAFVNTVAIALDARTALAMSSSANTVIIAPNVLSVQSLAQLPRALLQRKKPAARQQLKTS